VSVLPIFIEWWKAKREARREAAQAQDAARPAEPPEAKG
jgi:hypothetical protein